MGYKTHANLRSLTSGVAQFGSEKNKNEITERAEMLTNSDGIAIDAVNECLGSYNSFCNNLDRVFASTEKYLQQALENLEEVEKDNARNKHKYRSGAKS